MVNTEAPKPGVGFGVGVGVAGAGVGVAGAGVGVSGAAVGAGVGVTPVGSGVGTGVAPAANISTVTVSVLPSPSSASSVYVPGFTPVVSIVASNTPSSGVGHSTSAIPTGKSIGPAKVEIVISVSDSRFVVPLTYNGSPTVTVST